MDPASLFGSLGWVAVPLLVHAGVMAVDEFWFHRRRGLSRWERVGHPLDTASVLLCCGLCMLAPPSSSNLRLYVVLAAASSVLITKDEFVHHRDCSAGEQWLHSMLFVLHPVLLAIVALLWMRGALGFLLVQTALTLSFGLYQLLFWNVSWLRPRRESTTTSTTLLASGGTMPRTTPLPSCEQNPA